MTVYKEVNQRLWTPNPMTCCLSLPYCFGHQSPTE